MVDVRRAGSARRARARGVGDIGRHARGLVALALIVLLCLGVPVALRALTSTAFPFGWRSLSEIASELTTQDDGTLFLAVLAIAGWAGWATFTVAVVLEVPAQVRGLHPAKVRGLGAQQALAGGLVAAALAFFLLPSAASAAPRSGSGRTTPHPGQATSAFPVPGYGSSGSSSGGDPTEERAAAAARREYVVRPGDTLWDIAATHLGDGARWRQVADLNYGRRQPGGDTLDHTHRLRPGWRLVLPPTARAGSGTRRRIVRPGETLSEIALDELGDASRSSELLEASCAVVQPDGRRLTDPDLIYPGWTVLVPTMTSTSETSGRPVQPGESSSSTRAPLDPSWRDSTADPPRSRPTVGSVRSARADSADPEGDAAADAIDVRTAGGVGGLLAACLLAVLGARRWRQQRRRRPGQRIALPRRPVLDAEARLRAVAEPVGATHIDRALRVLAAEHRAVGRGLPGLRTARLTTTHLELYLAAPALLPAPWVATSDPTVWALTRTALIAQLETDTRAPFPALVTLGHDLDDAYVLVDLEQITALAVEGPRSDRLSTLAALAVELATSPWADDLQVTLAGCLPDLPSAVGTGRLRHVDNLQLLIDELEGRADDVQRVLGEAGAESVAAARGTGVADDPWPPEIVLLAHDLPEPERARLDQVLHRLPRVGIAAVTTAGPPFSEWRLVIDGGTDAARLEPTGLTIRPQRLEGAEHSLVIELLEAADSPAVPGPPWAAHVSAGEPDLAALSLAADDTSASASTPVDVSAQRHGAPFVRLLGPVDLLDAKGPEPVAIKEGRAVANHVARATALMAYLSCHPEGATVERVSEALSPIRRLSPSTVWSLASRTRKWLGSDSAGVPYLPRTTDGGALRLHPAVRSDWALWRELIGDDITDTELPRLMQALDLVRGRPFEGVTERHYTWAEPLRQEMIAGILDVAHEVAVRALGVPDPGSARRAASVGRLIDPANELMWRDALRVEYVAGNRESQHRLIEQLFTLADDLEMDLEPETESLIAQLERGPMARASPR